MKCTNGLLKKKNKLKNKKKELINILKEPKLQVIMIVSSISGGKDGTSIHINQIPA